MIYDVMVAWENYQQDRANGKLTPPTVDEETLLKVLQNSRG